MKILAIRQTGLALAIGALMGFGAGAMLAPEAARADDPAMVAENLLTSIYLEQKCGGKFSQAEWDRLIELVRELSPRGPEGEYVLSEMQTSKLKARDMTIVLPCSDKSIQDYRDIYARDLKPSL